MNKESRKRRGARNSKLEEMAVSGGGKWGKNQQSIQKCFSREPVVSTVPEVYSAAKTACCVLLSKNAPPAKTHGDKNTGFLKNFWRFSNISVYVSS